MPTPNIDALAYGGIILRNYYVNPICTPSRAALMSGLHPIHTGLENSRGFNQELFLIVTSFLEISGDSPRSLVREEFFKEAIKKVN